ncbi:hypothetical protein MAIT1_02267 [Magnetofaba australis IT-1]|uniref:Uncharacterized protein n=1 Tax=Magnetofaba australis IT-1 TaxID=1434232 RepID=A0A1Y2K3C3_9PROT|nr:hypothetical protein MAIT1_02267 [Magnetofaba australis IT-1]
MLFYLIFLVVFFAATPILTMTLYWEADLSVSILPELIGFSLQGGFLVLVFAVYEWRSARNARHNQKFTLRTYLGSFVDRSLFAITSPDLTGEGEVPVAEPPVLDLESMTADSISDGAAQRIQQFAERQLTSLEALSSVAAHIDYNHLDAWSVIVDDLHNIRGAVELSEVKDGVISLLRNIKNFDDLPLG